MAWIGLWDSPLDEVWTVVSQTKRLSQWMPVVERCTDLAGDEGIPGYVRLVSGFMFPRHDGERSWIKERLVAMDPTSHSYVYKMEASNVGLDGSVNSLKFVDYGDGSTLVNWSFEIDPLEELVECKIRHYHFSVVLKNATKLCTSKAILTVNGKFPGPTLYAREGDNVLVRVTNHVQYNVTIHWHGVRQLRTGWSDGPAYITQCPIQPGQNFVYNFTLTGQRGTLLWHAHISWLRTTMHGAIVILPKKGVPYPFPKPDKEKGMVEADTEAVVNQAMQTGLPPNISDAHTINGHPGPVPNCSSDDAYTLHVETGKTYLLRVVNAAVNDELFFKIAYHNLTVVEVDAAYTKPYNTDTLFLGPGQTTTALLKADKGVGKYLIAISPFMDTIVAVDNVTGVGYLRYNRTLALTPTTLVSIPSVNATPVTSVFSDSLRSLNSKEYPANVPLTVDHSLFFTIGVGINPCTTCINGSRAVASINNISFLMPTTALLQAHYYGRNGVYRLAYNSTVQLVIQGNNIVAPESHPTHLHGFNFFVVGRGVGNFDPEKDPSEFNLVDPVERNTVSVPTAGWTAIRFRADNPGVWFFHCHLEVHTTWGLKMAFLVENGEGPDESIEPPPSDLPKC
ncbi:Laccase-10 [Hibiscus syriacus]|uniref:Laccase n=1 Tax=Hibiscus syriacus TaxID=106335 RepID=A0A6A2ZVG4_HIBSY|nr:Laccase-10 [Hibiscus syriacus]